MPRSDVELRLSMARAATLLLLAGGVVGLLITLLPHPDRINETAYWVIDAAGVLSAAAVWLLRRRLPPVAYHGVSFLGILMVAFSIYYSGNDSGGALENELLFLWPILFAGYFFGRRGMIVQLLLVGAAYGGVLIAMGTGEEGLSRWGGTMGTLTAAAIFVRFLRERLDREISLHRSTIESTTDGILVVDGNGRWVSFNREFLEMWRIPPEITERRHDDEALEFALSQLEDPASFLARVRELYEQPDAESSDELRFKDGRIVERDSRPHRLDGRSVGRVWSFRDVTERKRVEARLQHLADHDPLTDLYNRRRFDEELGREVARAKRYGDGGALLVLDLDDLKSVNDNHGHLWGDEVIRSAANVLRGRLRSSDVLARIGGDEFAVLLPESDEVHALKLAEELLEVFRSRTVDTGHGSIQMTTSIGVVDLGEIADSGVEPLVAADTALYRAKGEGRDRLALFDPDGADRTPLPGPLRRHG
jgi:diguanylate cyclase (GGDEF)-like protein